MYGTASQFARKPRFRPRAAEIFARSHGRPHVYRVSESGDDAEPVSLTDQDDDTKTTHPNLTASSGEGTLNRQRVHTVGGTHDAGMRGSAVAGRTAPRRKGPDALSGRNSFELPVLFEGYAWQLQSEEYKREVAFRTASGQPLWHRDPSVRSGVWDRLERAVSSDGVEVASIYTNDQVRTVINYALGRTLTDADPSQVLPQIIDMRTRLGYSVPDKFKVYPEDLQAFRALDSRELSGLAKMCMETGWADNFLGAVVGGSLAARQSTGVGQAKVAEVQVRGIPKGPKLASEGVHAPARQAISAGAAKARQAMSAGAGAVKEFVRKITGGAADQVGKPAAVTIQIKPVEAIPDSYVARWRQGDVQGGMSFEVNSTDNSVSIDGIARGEQMPPRSAGSNAAAARNSTGCHDRRRLRCTTFERIVPYQRLGRGNQHRGRGSGTRWKTWPVSLVGRSRLWR